MFHTTAPLVLQASDAAMFHPHLAFAGEIQPDGPASAIPAYNVDLSSSRGRDATHAMYVPAWRCCCRHCFSLLHLPFVLVVVATVDVVFDLCE